MSEKELNAAIKRQDLFEPVELVLSNGATYEVKHPDAIMIRGRMAAITVGDVIHTISTIHVNQVRPLQTV